MLQSITPSWIKKAWVSIALIAAGPYTNAQFIELGVRGLANTTWLLNKNVNDQGSAMTYEFTVAPSGGVMAGLFLGRRTQIAVELLANRFVQNYTGTTAQGDEYESENELNSLEIPILLRGLAGLGYLEAGVQYSMIRSASHTNNLPDYTVYNGNTTSEWATSNVSLLAGFGADIGLAGDLLVLTLGLRGSIGLSDLEGTDGLGVDLDNSIAYPSYEKTHSATFGLLVGLSVRL